MYYHNIYICKNQTKVIYPVTYNNGESYKTKFTGILYYIGVRYYILYYISVYTYYYNDIYL